MMSECACEIVNNYLTLCDEHKQELERLKANPPAYYAGRIGGNSAKEWGIVGISGGGNAY